MVKNITGKNIKEVLTVQVEPSATLMADTLKEYEQPGVALAAHHTLNYSEGQYTQTQVLEDGTAIRVHIPTAEGFFSQLKRSIGVPIIMCPLISCIAPWQISTPAIPIGHSRCRAHYTSDAAHGR